ncbi:MarR family transcriptional regulator, partial [Nocardia gipuzkoensis]
AALRIAEFCAHLPLAITIAGRKIAAQPGRRLSEVADRLDAGVQVANWLWIGDIGLADSVLPAYLSLPPLAKHVVHMLAAGCDEVTPAELARTLHISIDSAEYAMDSLIDVGLLHRVPAPERYALPSLIGRLVAQETSRFAMHRDADTVELPAVRTPAHPFRG